LGQGKGKRLENRKGPVGTLHTLIPVNVLDEKDCGPKLQLNWQNKERADKAVPKNLATVLLKLRDKKGTWIGP